MNRALRVFDWIKIGAVVALLIFLIGHNFPIAYSPTRQPAGHAAGFSRSGNFPLTKGDHTPKVTFWWSLCTFSRRSRRGGDTSGGFFVPKKAPLAEAGLKSGSNSPDELAGTRNLQPSKRCASQARRFTPAGFPAGIFVNRLRLPFEQSRIS